MRDDDDRDQDQDEDDEDDRPRRRRRRIRIEDRHQEFSPVILALMAAALVAGLVGVLWLSLR